MRAPRSLPAARARRAARGFTLVELLIVTTLLAVLLAAGMPSFAEFMRNQRVKTASFDLFSSLVVARSEALTRNASVTLTPTGGTWSNGWTVTEPGGIVIREQEAIANVAIAGPASVVYTGSGRLNAGLAPQFELTAAGSSVVSRCISIDLSGRPVSKAAQC